MRTISYVCVGIVVALLFVAIWYVKRVEPQQPEYETIIHVDTLTYQNIAPKDITPPNSDDSLSVYHFVDSVDGRWSADVAGHDVELRSLVLRESIESRYSTSYSPPKWEVGVQGGFSDNSAWVGLGVERDVGRLKFSLGAGYDPFKKSPHVEGSVGVVLWREY